MDQSSVPGEAKGHLHDLKFTILATRNWCMVNHRARWGSRLPLV